MAFARIVTAADVEWSDGIKFQGTLVLLYVPPVLDDANYPNIYPRITASRKNFPLALPQRMSIPIVNGVVQDNRILPTINLTPPNVRFYDYWVDSAGVIVGSGVALFPINVEADYTLTVPTLTSPTAETDIPDLTSPSTAQVITTLTITTVIHEELTGTKNGSNLTFTISAAPVNFMILFFNGFKLDLGTDFTRSGTTITLLTAAPISTDNLEAMIF
jgi:hypothetical protein